MKLRPTLIITSQSLYILRLSYSQPHVLQVNLISQIGVEMLHFFRNFSIWFEHARSSTITLSAPSTISILEASASIATLPYRERQH